MVWLRVLIAAMSFALIGWYVWFRAAGNPPASQPLPADGAAAQKDGSQPALTTGATTLTDDQLNQMLMSGSKSGKIDMSSQPGTTQPLQLQMHKNVQQPQRPIISGSKSAPIDLTPRQ